jgi:hypothetical protein
MTAQNIFSDDWQACLRAHYIHTLRERDANNEQSLREVLLQVGFSEGDLALLQGQVPVFGVEPSAAEGQPDTVDGADPMDEAPDDGMQPDATLDVGPRPDDDEPPNPTQLSLF